MQSRRDEARQGEADLQPRSMDGTVLSTVLGPELAAAVEMLPPPPSAPPTKRRTSAQVAKQRQQEQLDAAAAGRQRMALLEAQAQEAAAASKEEEQLRARQKVIAERASKKREVEDHTALENATATFDYLLAVGQSAREELLTSRQWHQTPRGNDSL